MIIKKRFFCLFSILIFLYSCSNVSEEFDKELIGIWVSVDSLELQKPGPHKHFTVMEISDDQTLLYHSIHIETGKIKNLGQSAPRYSIKTVDGVIKVDRKTKKRTIIIHPRDMNYHLSNGKLYISYGGSHQRVYERRSLNEVITEPYSIDFKCMIDSREHRSPEYHNQTPAFVSNMNNVLYVNSVLENSIDESWDLSIKIENFSGVGTYEIPFEAACLRSRDGCVIISMKSDSVNTGRIFINEYDDVKNICSGTFSFDLKSEMWNSISDENKKNVKIRNGEFSAPIYK